MGTKIETGADGQVTLGGAKLPSGAAVVTNADGSKSIQGNVPETRFQQKLLNDCQERCIAVFKVGLVS